MWWWNDASGRFEVREASYFYLVVNLPWCFGVMSAWSRGPPWKGVGWGLVRCLETGQDCDAPFPRVGVVDFDDVDDVHLKEPTDDIFEARNAQGWFRASEYGNEIQGSLQWKHLVAPGTNTAAHMQVGGCGRQAA